ncbi:hypothetical protein [Roseovarius sp. EL26]|uniref:hypothetical protein n=1 Tax=Roseovarius sp. EL26 TaxID=2126672 RepID=UPI0013C52439|nr:hypothetical protein [Roseovarius sp. EL26]
MPLPKHRLIIQFALNLIRIALGSYFIGVSLDLFSGVDQRSLFLPFLSFEWADLVGSTLLFGISVAFMTGIHTRTFALVLTMFVMCSSVAQHIYPFDLGQIAAIWRDLTLSAAVLMAYTNVVQADMQRPSLPKRSVRTTSTEKTAKLAARRIDVARPKPAQKATKQRA